MYITFIKKKFNKYLSVKFCKKESYFYSIIPINGCIIYYPRFLEILNRFFSDLLCYDRKYFILNNYYEPATIIDNSANDYNKRILGIDLGYYIIIFMRKNRHGKDLNNIILHNSKKIVKEYPFY